MANNQINDWREIPLTEAKRNAAIADVYSAGDDPNDWQEISLSKQALETPPSRGFISDAGAAITNRANELADNIVAYKNNEKSAPELAMNFFGKAGAGTANDLIGAGINAVTPDIVKRGLATGAQDTANAVDNTGVGQEIGDTLMSARDKFNSFMKNNPRTASQLESLGNIAALAPSANASEPISNGIRSVAANTSTGLRGLSESYAAKYPIGTAPFDPLKMKIAEPINADVVKNASQNAYRDAGQLGAGFQPTFATKAHAIIQEAKIKPFADDILTTEDAAVNSALNDFDKLAGKKLTLNDYQRLDSSLGDKATQAYVGGDANKGRIISQVQDKIRDLVSPNNLKETDLIGDREGIDALTQHAIPLWSTQAKMQDIEKIINRANMMDNSTTAMRTGFRNLALNKNRMASYPKDVQKLIQKAAVSGKADDLLGVLGSRLNVIAGGAVGGLPGVAISSATSMASRGIRDAFRNKKADKIINSLGDKVRPSIEQYNYTIPEQLPPLKEIMKMPPAQARAILAKYKSTPAL